MILRHDSTPRKNSECTLNVEALEERQMLSTVQIFAAGTTGEELIQLSIDENVVASFSNLGAGANSGNFQTLTFNTPDTIAADQVRIEFVNDLFDACINYRHSKSYKSFLQTFLKVQLLLIQSNHVRIYKKKILILNVQFQ